VVTESSIDSTLVLTSIVIGGVALISSIVCLAISLSKLKDEYHSFFYYLFFLVLSKNHFRAGDTKFRAYCLISMVTLFGVFLATAFLASVK
jgi:hypothetical protein